MNLRTAILHCLRDGEATGRELKARLRALEWFWDVDGRLYFILSDLQDEGLVEVCAYMVTDVFGDGRTISHGRCEVRSDIPHPPKSYRLSAPIYRLIEPAPSTYRLPSKRLMVT